ncbi:serine/arginine repetitive matrix protein 2 [Hetaerina americana]|uniref:serine/arginine repetitive matrix protein 2 n=1 Tax=Hetaerina americana TaxID=62018 RepID=UPI003A7F1FB2
MYNGIGLPTPRGSGTNGYVQRNWAYVRKTKDKVHYKTEEELEKLEAHSNRQPNREILDHERKRKVEVKCIELEEILEEQGCSRKEIEAKVNTYRNMLMESGRAGSGEIPRDEFGRILVRETHQVAEAQQEKNAKLREAFGISEYFVEGSSLDPNRRAKEAAARAAAAVAAFAKAAAAAAAAATCKQYALVRTPSPEPIQSTKESNKEGEKTKKRKKKARDSSSSSEPKEKREKKKKSSKKHKRDKSDSPGPESGASSKKKKKAKEKTKKKALERQSRRRRSSPSVSPSRSSSCASDHSSASSSDNDSSSPSPHKHHKKKGKKASSSLTSSKAHKPGSDAPVTDKAHVSRSEKRHGEGKSKKRDRHSSNSSSSSETVAKSSSKKTRHQSGKKDTSDGWRASPPEAQRPRSFVGSAPVERDRNDSKGGENGRGSDADAHASKESKGMEHRKLKQSESTTQEGSPRKRSSRQRKEEEVAERKRRERNGRARPRHSSASSSSSRSSDSSLGDEGNNHGDLSKFSRPGTIHSTLIDVSGRDRKVSVESTSEPAKQHSSSGSGARKEKRGEVKEKRGGSSRDQSRGHSRSPVLSKTESRDSRSSPGGRGGGGRNGSSSPRRWSRRDASPEVDRRSSRNHRASPPLRHPSPAKRRDHSPIRRRDRSSERLRSPARLSRDQRSSQGGRNRSPRRTQPRRSHKPGDYLPSSPSAHSRKSRRSPRSQSPRGRSSSPSFGRDGYGRDGGRGYRDRPSGRSEHADMERHQRRGKDLHHSTKTTSRQLKKEESDSSRKSCTVESRSRDAPKVRVRRSSSEEEEEEVMIKPGSSKPVATPAPVIELSDNRGKVTPEQPGKNESKADTVESQVSKLSPSEVGEGREIITHQVVTGNTEKKGVQSSETGVISKDSPKVKEFSDPLEGKKEAKSVIPSLVLPFDVIDAIIPPSRTSSVISEKDSDSPDRQSNSLASSPRQSPKPSAHPTSIAFQRILEVSSPTEKIQEADSTVESVPVPDEASSTLLDIKQNRVVPEAIAPLPIATAVVENEPYSSRDLHFRGSRSRSSCSSRGRSISPKKNITKDSRARSSSRSSAGRRSRGRSSSFSRSWSSSLSSLSSSSSSGSVSSSRRRRAASSHSSSSSSSSSSGRSSSGGGRRRHGSRGRRSHHDSRSVSRSRSRSTSSSEGSSDDGRGSGGRSREDQQGGGGGGDGGGGGGDAPGGGGSTRASSHSSSRSGSSRSRARSSRSPSIPRRRGSPSFLDRRRITSARKRPIPYHRPTPSSRSSSHSSSTSRSRSRSYSRCSSSWSPVQSPLSRHSRSRSRSVSYSP